jgi:hypothetical protein
VSRGGKGGRVRDCTAADARKRLADARMYLEMAEMAATEDNSEAANVATGNAVLAGIAAADAACCQNLGESSRGQDHRDAAGFLRRVHPGGEQAAKDFERLIAVKDKAHYGFVHVASSDLKAAIRQAGKLVKFAEAVVER